MPSPDAHAAKRLFLEALERPLAERAAFLERACGGDASLRTLVESLLDAAEEGRGLLERTPAARAGVFSDPEQLLGTFLGPYKLLQVIGEGGFGTVYMAEQTRPVVRRVAVKVLKAGMDTREVIARFEAERQALALMDHPNIARVLDAGEAEGGRSYFVMELVHGVPITQFCDDARLPVPERLELFRSVCLALQHAHQKGVIHRDVKPSNVLVTMLDDKPLAKVIDFGIAKAMNQRLTDKTLFTRFGQFLGTPAYMSPEQAQFSALDVDTRSDVYSLGVLLYELLTGVTPFDVRRLLEIGLQEIQRVISEVEPPRPSTRLSTLDDLKTVADRRSTEPAKLSQIVRGDLDWVVMKCLEKDRARRYDSAGALAADLERYLTRRPVEATPPSARYRLRKLVQRNRALVLGLSAVAATLVIGLCVSVAGFLSASRQRDAKQSALGAAQAATKAAEAAQADAEDFSKRLLVAKEELEQQSLELRRSLYVRSIGFADAALRAGNASGARELLAQCPPEERGWEWSHLWLVAHPGGEAPASLGSTVSGRDVRPTGSVMSADGRRVASSFSDGRIVVRETDGLRAVRDLQAFPAGRVEARRTPFPVRYAPIGDLALSADGRLLAAVGTDQDALKLWDVDTGAELNELARDEGAWTALAFSRDGRALAARRSWGGQSWSSPTWWELPAGARHELAYARAGAVPSTDGVALAFADGDRALLGVGPERALDLWELSTGSVVRSFPLPGSNLLALTTDPEGALAFAGFEHETSVLELASGRELARLPGVALQGALAADGRSVAMSGPLLRVANARTGELLHTFAGAGEPLALAFAPDGRLFAAGGALAVLDVSSDDAYCTLRTQGAFNTHAEFTRDGAYLAVGTVTEDGPPSVAVFEVVTGRLVQRFEGSEVFALDPRGAVIALAEGAPFPGLGPVPPNVGLRDLATGLARGRLEPLKGTPSALAFSPDGRRLAVATMAPGNTSQGGTQLYAAALELWDVERAQPVASFEAGTSFIDALFFSSDGARLLANGNGERLRLFDAETARLVESWSYAFGMAFSPDALLLARPHPGGGVELFSAEDGKHLRRVGRAGQQLTSLAFLPDGRTLAGTSRGRVVLWDLETDAELLALDPPPASVSWSEVAASADGARLAAVADAGRVDLLETSLPDQAARRAREAAFVEQRAEELVAQLKQELLLAEDVSARLADDRIEREDVRRAALALVVDEPLAVQALRLNDGAWRICRSPDESAERYRTAARSAVRAVELAPDNGDYSNTLGLALIRDGAFERAVAALLRSEELNHARFPGGLPLDAAFLAMALAGLGDAAGAREALARSERLALDRMWKDDPELRLLLAQAEAAVAAEPYDRALEADIPSPEALRRTAERRERLLGTAHPAVAEARHRLADVWNYLGHRDHALMEGRRAYELAAVSGEDLPCLVEVRRCLAARLVEVGAEQGALGLHEEDAALCAEAVAVARALPPQGRPMLADHLARLATALLAAGDAVAAEPAARECLALRKELYPDAHPDLWRRYNAQSLLGGALLERATGLAAGDPAAAEALLAEAEELLLEACERMQPPEVVKHRTAEALERLVRVYEARSALAPGRGYEQRAEVWREELARHADPGR